MHVLVTTQTRTAVRYQKILDAALGVFASRGYREAAVDDIASAAETSKGGIYFHFPGKQAIFMALLDRSSNLLLSRIVTAVDSQTEPVAKADAALLAVLELFGGHRSLARLFLVEAMGAGPEFHSRIVALYDRFADLIRRNLDEAVVNGTIAPLDTRIASLIWFGALNQIVTSWALTENPPPLRDSYPALRGMLLRSIGVDPVNTPDARQ